jgi:hypothetical protein
MLGWFRKQSPEEKEIARCENLKRSGRRVEGLITEVEAETVFYQYEIRGVSYQAAQDFRLINGALPGDSSELLGPATVQYENTNPANSRLVLEERSGTR